jgi:hypothetical protein
LYVTKGRPSRAQVSHASFWTRASQRSTSSTSIPASRRREMPSRVGSFAPTTTFAIPASRTASTHGGWEP